MLREKLNGIMVVAMVAIFTSCGVGSAPPQSGININICNSAGTTGDCSQEAANTNTAQISQPGGGGGIPPIPPIPPPGGDGGVDGDGGEDHFKDTSWLPSLFKDASDPHADDNLTDDLAAAIDATMPEIPPGINAAPDGPPGSESVDPNNLQNLFGDTNVIAWQYALGRQFGETSIGSYAVHASRGLLIGFNRLLGGNIAELGSQPQEYESGVLRGLSSSACTNHLGVVSEEMEEIPKITTEFDAGVDFQGRTVEYAYGNTHIIWYRRIGDIPVVNSWCHITVNRQGQIISAEAQWPQFKLNGALAVLTRTEARDRLLGSVVDQGFGEIKVGVLTVLTYRPIRNPVGSPTFIPALKTEFRYKDESRPAMERASFDFITPVVE